MRWITAALVLALAGAMPSLTLAAADTYAITAEEHAACDADVVNLCSDVSRDADSVIGCMKSNRERLSPVCKTAFTDGMRRRHLPM